MEDPKRDDAEVPKNAKESADTDEGLKHEPEDHAQGVPGEEDTPDGPGVGDAFRGGS